MYPRRTDQRGDRETDLGDRELNHVVIEANGESMGWSRYRADRFLWQLPAAERTLEKRMVNPA